MYSQVCEYCRIVRQSMRVLSLILSQIHASPTKNKLDSLVFDSYYTFFQCLIDQYNLSCNFPCTIWVSKYMSHVGHSVFSFQLACMAHFRRKIKK